MVDGKRVPDAIRSQLRSIVAAVDHSISNLEMDDSQKAIELLKNNWNELLALLAVGPEPEYRECVSCHYLGMRLATRCGFCWAKFSPLLVK